MSKIVRVVPPTLIGPGEGMAGVTRIWPPKGIVKEVGKIATSPDTQVEVAITVPSACRMVTVAPAGKPGIVIRGPAGVGVSVGVGVGVGLGIGSGMGVGVSLGVGSGVGVGVSSGVGVGAGVGVGLGVGLGVGAGMGVGVSLGVGSGVGVGVSSGVGVGTGPTLILSGKFPWKRLLAK